MPSTVKPTDTLAQRLKSARVAAGFSQRNLAELVGVSQGSIGTIETNDRRVPRELEAIARVIQVNEEWLKTGRGPKQRAPETNVPWPFTSIHPHEWSQLTKQDKSAIESVIRTALDLRTVEVPRR